MNKYVNIYNIGFKDGLLQAFKDVMNKKHKKFKNYDDAYLKSKIYDIGYINGYNIFYNKLKNDLDCVKYYN